MLGPLSKSRHWQSRMKIVHYNQIDIIDKDMKLFRMVMYKYKWSDADVVVTLSHPERKTLPGFNIIWRGMTLSLPWKRRRWKKYLWVSQQRHVRWISPSRQLHYLRAWFDTILLPLNKECVHGEAEGRVKPTTPLGSQGRWQVCDV